MSDEKKPRVLMIDDGLGDRGLLRQSLAPRGYQLFTAECSAKSVVDHLAAFAPHVLVLDMAMQGLDPIEVLLAVRRVDTKLPVIILNASASASSVLKTLTLGHCEYLFRPFDAGRLCNLIDAAVTPPHKS